MTSRSRVEASAWSRATASVPATWLSGSGGQRGAQGHARCRRPPRSRGRASMTASTSATPLPSLTMRAPAMPVDALGGGGDGLRVAGRHDDGRVGAAGREGLGQALARRDRLGLLEELVGGLEAGVDEGDAGGHDREHDEGDADDALGVRGDAVADLAPQRLAVGQGGLALARHPGPEDPAVEDDEGGGQHEQDEGRGTTMPTAQASPRPRVAGKSESSSVSRPRTTVTELERTASAVRRRASDIASRRSWWLRSSSR